MSAAEDIEAWIRTRWPAVIASIIVVSPFIWGVSEYIHGKRLEDSQHEVKNYERITKELNTEIIKLKSDIKVLEDYKSRSIKVVDYTIAIGPEELMTKSRPRLKNVN